MQSIEETFLARGRRQDSAASSESIFGPLLPHGYADTHNAEDVRKFVIVQGMTSILALSHLAVLGFLSTSASSSTCFSFFALAICMAFLLELMVLFLLRCKRDVTQAALLLALTINMSTIALCAHYGVVAEIYIWLGWVPKILSFTYGGQGGVLGLVAVAVQGAVLYLLHIHGLAPSLDPPAGIACGEVALVEIDQAARLLHVNAYLLCFGLTAAVHEYCRAHTLQQLRDALADMQQANAGLKTAAEAKSIFLASTSHELRTPLHGILAISESLLDDDVPQSRDNTRKSLHTITESGKHLIQLLNRILDFEKLSSGKVVLESIPFSATHETELICATFAALMDKKKVRLEKEFEIEPSLQHLGDPLRFRQVLCNLLSNAIKFTPSGGTIKVAISTTTDDKEGALLVEVADTGIGFSEDTKAKLFQDFIQGDSSISRKYGGTGLGLAITKRFVDAMHGEIGCRSVEGQGSTFWFVLPLPLAEAHAGETGEPHTRDGSSLENDESGDVTEPVDLRGTRVLVVDDNALNQKICLNMLRQLGCLAQVAVNGQDCLEILANCQDFDVILMDFLMPVLDGLEATKRIRAGELGGAKSAGGRLRNVPVIGLTATPEELAAKLASDAGMDGVLYKPFNKAQLAAVLRRWTARRL